MPTSKSKFRSRINRSTAFLLAIAMGMSVLVAVAPPASAQVAPAAPTPSEPPITGHSVAVFPTRDFVSVAGYPATTTSATIEVFRGRLLTGRVTGLIPGDNPLTPEFEGTMEINHPGEPCWGPLVGTDGATAVTPNIIGGDVVRVTYTYIGDLGEVITAADQVTASMAELTVPAFAPGAEAGFGPDTVLVKGTADDGRGRQLDLRPMEVQIRSGSGRFDANGTAVLTAAVTPVNGTLGFDPINALTNPAGTNWTATFTGLSELDVLRATSGSSDITEVFGGLGTGVSIHEGPGGPEGGCTPVPGSPGAPLPPPLDGAVASATPATSYFEPVAQTPPLTNQTTRVVTINNVGFGATAGLNVTGFSIEGTNAPSFRVLSNTCIGTTVPTGGSCTATVAMRSATATVKNAQLIVLSNSAHGAISADLVGLITGAGAAPAPYLIARPNSLALGTRSVGTPSRPYLATVTNIGNGAVSAVTATKIGVNAADFTATVADTCNVALATNGGQCAVSVSMTPRAVGPRVASVRISDPAAPVVASVAVSGNGLDVNNVISPIPAGMELGTFPGREFVSAAGFDPDSYSVQVIRHGEVVSQATDITPVDNPVTPEFEGGIEVNHPGEPCWERVAPDLRFGDRVRVVNSAGTAWESYVHGVEAFASPTDPSTSVIQINENTIEVHGRALGEDGERIPAAEVAFELVAGTANPFEVNGRRAIGAPGDGQLRYDPVSAENPDGTRWTARFTGLVGRDVTRAMFESEQASIWATEAATEATINEFGAAEEGGCVPKLPDTNPPIREALTGDTFVTPSSIEFPPRTRTTTADRTINIRNSGPAPLNVAGFSVRAATLIEASRFTVLAETCSGTPIAIEASCTATVRFTSGGLLGAHTADLLIDDDVAGTKIVPMTASVVAAPVAYLTISERSVVFEDTAVASVATQNVTITNDGQAATTGAPALSFSGANADMFSVTGCAAELAVDESCIATLTWTPSKVGTATGVFEVRTPQGAATGLTSMAVSGYSGVTSDGFNDPPVSHPLIVFPIRDYVFAEGFAANEMVTIQVMRPDATGNLTEVGRVEQLVPTDDPATPLFDGIVEINENGNTACWSGTTPDIAVGDYVRATAVDLADTAEFPTPTAKEQTYVQDIEVTSGAVQVLPQAVAVTGRISDARGGALPPAASLEVRIIARASFSTGFSSLRTGRDGFITVNPDGTWIALFGSLTPADIALAESNDPKILWLGRTLEAGTEQTHIEWNENPGPQVARCPAHGLGELEFANEPVAQPAAVTNVGLSGVNTPGGQSATIPVRNVGQAATTITGVSLVGLHPNDFAITGGTCVGASVRAGGSCNFVVTMTATAAGKRDASLRVTHTGVNDPEFHGVTGRGVGVPTITAIEPAAAGVGTRIVVRGTSFSGVTGVTIGGVPATGLTFVDDSSVSVVVPRLATTGVTDVTLTTVAGSATSVGGFTYLPDPPVITGVVLPGAPVIAGKAVVVQGTALSTVTAVTVGGISVPRDTISVAPAAPNGFRINLDGTITVTLPAGTPDAAIISVTNPGGTVTSAPITVVQPPRITSASVASGRVGTIVTFTGTNLGNVPTVLPALAGVTTVRFTGPTAAGILATAVTRVSATTMRVTVPAGALAGPITLTGPAGSSTFSGFTVLSAPLVQSVVGIATVSGANQTTIGREITVRGIGFVGVSGVTVGGTRATSFTVVTDTELRAVVGARTAAGAQRVAVSTGGGTGTSAANVTVTVVPAPTITALSALSGRAGSIVTVTGTNLQYVNELRLATRVVPFTRVGAGATQRLSFVVPVGALSGAVQVITLAGSGLSVQAYRVIV